MLIDPHPCGTLAQRRITFLIRHHENKGGSGFDADAFKHDYQRAKRICAAAEKATGSREDTAADRVKRDIADYERRERRERARRVENARQREERARVLREKRARVWGRFDTTPAPASAHAPAPMNAPAPAPASAPMNAPMNARDMQVYDMAMRKGADERRARQFVDIARKIRGRK